MAIYHFLLSDDIQAEMSLDQGSKEEAISTGLNALTQFLSKQFPPPPTVSISISDAHRFPVAELSFSFTIADNATMVQ